MSLNYVGNWSSSTTYSRGQVVVYSGIYFACIGTTISAGVAPSGMSTFKNSGWILFINNTVIGSNITYYYSNGIKVADDPWGSPNKTFYVSSTLFKLYDYLLDINERFYQFDTTGLAYFGTYAGLTTYQSTMRYVPGSIITYNNYKYYQASDSDIINVAPSRKTLGSVTNGWVLYIEYAYISGSPDRIEYTTNGNVMLMFTYTGSGSTWNYGQNNFLTNEIFSYNDSSKKLVWTGTGQWNGLQQNLFVAYTGTYTDSANWSSSTSYTTGQTTPYTTDGITYYAGSPAPSVGTAPARNTINTSGWIRVYASGTGQDYLQNEFTYHTATTTLYRAFDAINLGATPTTIKTTLTGWIPVDSSSTSVGQYSWRTSGSNWQNYTSGGWVNAWLTGQNYAANTQLAYLGYQYITRGAQNNTSAPSSVTSSLTSWIPFWQSTSYSTGNLVYQSSVYYIAASATTSGNSPSSPNTTGTLWIPIWTSGSYNSNSFVSDGTDTYVAASAVTAANTLGVNTTGKSNWVPLWKSGNSYSQGQYTYNSGAYYFAFNSNVTLSTTTPVIANTTGNGWVTLDSSSTTIGHYSYKTSTSKLQAYVNQDGVNTWVDAWLTSASYTSNTTLAHLTKAYVTRGAQNAGVTPQTNTSNLNDWIPYWISGTYSQNHLVYRNGVYYVNNDASTTSTPASPNTTGTAWVPLWSNVNYSSNNFIVSNGVTYVAATSVTSNDTPATNTFGKTGWVPMWKSGNSYAQGHYVYYNSNYYYASDNSNLSTATPAVSNTSGWIIVGIPQAPTVGNIALVGSNVQSFVPVGSNNTWVNAWAASNANFNPGTIVSSGGRAYAALKSQASNVQPTLVKNNINAWIPVWSSNDVNYDALNYTHHNGRFFVASTPLSSYAQPNVSNSNLTGWVTLWDSNMGFNSNTFVFGDKSLAFYQAKSNVPLNNNVSPDDDKQEQYWKMSSIPLAGSLSLTRLRGLMLSRLNN